MNYNFVSSLFFHFESSTGRQICSIVLYLSLPTYDSIIFEMNLPPMINSYFFTKYIHFLLFISEHLPYPLILLCLPIIFTCYPSHHTQLNFIEFASEWQKSHYIRTKHVLWWSFFNEQDQFNFDGNSTHPSFFGAVSSLAMGESKEVKEENK